MGRFVSLLFAGAAFCAATFSVAYAAGTSTLEINPQRDSTYALPSDPQGAMEAARELVAAGDLEGAIRGLSRYVAGHPGEIMPARLLGDLYYRRGDLGRAEAQYKAILALVPRDKETHNRLGSVYATQNRIEDAIDEFNRSLPGTDSVPDLVKLHMRKGDFSVYMAERERAAREYPTDPEWQLELGQVYEAVHRPDLAILYFRRALDQDPSSLFALNGLGLAFLDEDQYDSAIEDFQTCLRHDQYYYACADNLGAAYLESKRFAGAGSILAFAHKLQPERSEALVNLGYLADANGDWKKAVSYYIQAMTVYPYSPDSYIDLGYTYTVHGLYQLAQSALVKGLAVAPGDGRLHFLLGDAYARQGNQSLAEMQFRAAATSDDPDVKRLAQERVAALEGNSIRP